MDKEAVRKLNNCPPLMSEEIRLLPLPQLVD